MSWKGLPPLLCFARVCKGFIVNLASFLEKLKHVMMGTKLMTAHSYTLSCACIG